MFAYIKTWATPQSDRRAVTSLEYALIAAVLVATIMAGFQIFANDMSTSFSNIGGSV
jgi:Flp pilus assembly pilin Flp